MPAKQYHIYGAALVSCEMIKRGYPAALVKRIQPALAWAYRTQRMDAFIRGKERGKQEDPNQYLFRYDQASDADWDKYGASVKKLAKEGEKQLIDALNGLWQSFDAYEQAPPMRPWNVIDKEKTGLAYEEIVHLREAFESWQKDPDKSPLDPPLSYEEFQKKMGKRANNNPWGYQNYLEALEIARVHWRSAALKNHDNETNDFYAARLPWIPRHIEEKLRPQLSDRSEIKAYFAERFEKDPEFKRKAEEYAVGMDAGYLFRRSTFSGKFKVLGKEVNMPYTNLKLPIPDWVRSAAGFNKKPNGWDSERFEKAKALADSWLIDWKWTVEQHRVGAQFAAEHCQPDPQDPGIPLSEMEPTIWNAL